MSARRSGRRSTGRARAVSRKATGHELVPVICSECFEEFCFDTGVDSDSLTCPICEHSAARPDDGTLHRISSLRKAEKTNFAIAFLLTSLASGAFVAWAVLMKNHGLLVAGRSLRRAADMVEIIDRSAQIILGGYAVGREPPTLPEEVVKMLRRMGDLVA